MFFRLIFTVCLFGLIMCITLPECGLATPTKYPGFFYTNNGDVEDISPYKWNNTKFPDQCKYLCRIDDQCLVATYYQGQKCSFYNTTKIIIDSTKQQDIYIWRPCAWNQAFEPPDHRCQGLFMRYYETTVKVLYDYLILGRKDNTNVPQCQELCYSNPICEAVTYNNTDRSCSLHQLWPVGAINQTYDKETDLYKWTCIPGFVEKLNVSKLPRQPNVLKCTGYWDIIARNQSLPYSRNPGVHFQTQSYKSCLAECTGHPSCTEAFFNVSVGLCVLPHTETSNRNKYLESFTFIYFQWICIANDSKPEDMTEKEEEYAKMGFECKTLINDSDLFIAEDNCGHFPELGKFVRCQGRSVPRLWTVTDACLVNQSFWMFPETKHMTISKDDRLYNATKIFTGLTSFWILYPKKSTFRNASFMECRRFNGAKGSEVSHNIVARSQWYAFPPIKPLYNYSNTPINIVLTESGKPIFGCRTKGACTNILRNLQLQYFRGSGATNQFYDIPYNFMLDEEGTIYEGRGWTNQCGAVLDYNYNSLCFAFIGAFQHKWTTVKFLTGVKQLIEFAVKQGHVDRNYTLYIHQDVTKVTIHRNYAVVIKEWYRYRGYIPKSCINIIWLSLCISIILISIFVAVAILVYRQINGRKHCKKCDFVHKSNFRLIYPQKDYFSQSEIPELLDNFGNTGSCIISVKSSLIPPKPGGDFLTIIKLWYVNKFIQSCCSLHVDTDLSSYLRHHTFYQDKVKVYEAYSAYHGKGTEDNLYIVFFCSDTETYTRFESLLSNDLCICDFFSIKFLTFSHLTFDIV